MKIYVASSWRNERYPRVVEALRDAGHEPYDFRAKGFNWREVGVYEDFVSPRRGRQALAHERATRAFSMDKAAMSEADAAVLVLPAGNDAHLEAGWLSARGVPTAVLLEPGGFKLGLMYGLTDALLDGEAELLAWLDDCVVCREN